MKYKFNIIQSIKAAEARQARERFLRRALRAGSLGFLVIALLYSALQVNAMYGTVRRTSQRLDRIQKEFNRYKSSKMTIQKSDITLLDNMQEDRIYWTRILVALARHLPKNYWITSFDYGEQELTVKGFGYITQGQRQLIALNKYTNLLRGDSTFTDEFTRVFLKKAVRNDADDQQPRISFEFKATKGAKKP
jgi:Tfp pilus assembly protein PilN